MRETSDAERLSRGQRFALGGAVVLAIGLAAYGAVGSYATVSTLAANVGVPLPMLVPIGIDGGLVGVVVLDLVLAWTGSPVGWLRQLARLLTVGTVAANVTGGWPDPVAVGLHAAAPLMLLVMVEAGRAVLLRRVGLAAGTAREGIPFGRWVLSPWRTWLLWRRMVLWRITSYDAALEVEARLRRARALLLMRYGRRWRRETPTDLVWMLRSGLFVEEAFARVDALLLKEGRDVVSPVVDDGVSVSARRGVTEGKPGVMGVEENQFQEVIRINERHWARCGRPVSAETVRKHLRIGAARARALTQAARAGDIAAVTGETVAVE